MNSAKAQQFGFKDVQDGARATLLRLDEKTLKITIDGQEIKALVDWLLEQK